MTTTLALIILIVTVAIELIFATYCIARKTYLKRIRSFLRIGAFALFLMALTLSFIKWNFRTWPFAILLFLWTIIGVVNLLQNKEEKRLFRSSRMIGKAIGAILLVFLVMLPALLFPEYKMIDTTGNFEVTTALYTYIDENRIETYTDSGEFRKLNVEFWYPEGAEGTYPLILFSHGGFGIKTSNESLYNELASHGYVVCSIDHTFQCFSTKDAEGNTISMDPGYRNEVMKEDAKVDKYNSFECYQKWMNIRTGDIDFILNTILDKAEKNAQDFVYQLVDTSKIGVMGHSLGGSAALGVGRNREDVSAVVALESPFMGDIVGVENNEFVFVDEEYPKPVLNVYSDSIWGLLGVRAQYAENYAMLTDQDTDTHNVYIQEVGHLALTDLSLTTPILTSILDGKLKEKDPRYCLKVINDITLEFFDCYLKGEGEFTSEGTY